MCTCNAVHTFRTSWHSSQMMMCKGESNASKNTSRLKKKKKEKGHPKEIIKTTHTTVVSDNNGKKGQKKNIAEVACRRALLKRSGVAAAGKYLWSCHGTRPRLRILFKQSLSEHREGDGDTVSLQLPCGPLSQHHTQGKQWSHAGTGAAWLKIAEQGFGEWQRLEPEVSRGEEVQVWTQRWSWFTGAGETGRARRSVEGWTDVRDLNWRNLQTTSKRIWWWFTSASWPLIIYKTQNCSSLLPISHLLKAEVIRS